MTVTEDEVNLATRRPEVGGEELQPLALELFLGCALSQFAVAEMPRLLGPAPPGLDARSQLHAMPEKDFFDCDPASFYNCRVLNTIGNVIW
jgi:hypothetical protein